MSHRNARLTPTGRRIHRRARPGRPSRCPCGQGNGHLADLRPPLDQPVPDPWLGRSGGPELQTKVLPARHSGGGGGRGPDSSAWRTARGPTDLAVRCGTSARTVSRILARAGMPRLWDLDPVTGERIRASRATDRRYERDAPGRHDPRRRQETRADPRGRRLAGRPGTEPGQPPHLTPETGL
jgi:hypothetical protein